jgi:hypothetical protein
MLAEDRARAIPSTMALILQTEEMLCMLYGKGGVVKCTAAVKATQTMADGIVCATGDAAKDATWLDLLLKGDNCG